MKAKVPADKSRFDKDNRLSSIGGLRNDYIILRALEA
jgi:hypothetical protein